MAVCRTSCAQREHAAKRISAAVVFPGAPRRAKPAIGACEATGRIGLESGGAAGCHAGVRRGWLSKDNIFEFFADRRTGGPSDCLPPWRFAVLAAREQMLHGPVQTVRSLRWMTSRSSHTQRIAEIL